MRPALDAPRDRGGACGSVAAITPPMPLLLDHPWITLALAGLLEVTWAIGLKLSDGFTRPLPAVVTVIALIASVWLLALAARALPIGTAYAVWVGIGAVGAAILGVVLFDEPTTGGRIFFLALLVVALVGLKLTSPS